MVEQRGFIKRALLPVWVGLGYLFLYLPIVILILFSFSESTISLSWNNFSLKWYYDLFANEEMLEALQVSLIVATCATLLSVTLGVMLTAASYWWCPSFLYPSFYSNILLPDMVLALGLLTLFHFCNFPLGYPSLILGHTLLGLGFMVPILRARFSQLDSALIEASLDLGASYQQTVKKIIVPLLFPAVIAGGLLVFTLSLDDFLIAFFCAGPKLETLSLYIFFQIKHFVSPSINAVSTLLFVFSSLMVFLLSYYNLLGFTITED